MELHKIVKLLGNFEFALFGSCTFIENVETILDVIGCGNQDVAWRNDDNQNAHSGEIEVDRK